MIQLTNVRVWLASAPVDMRRSFDSLAEHVRAFLGHDPLGGHLFVFRSRSGHSVKVLWWDRNGLVLYYKRLERGSFSFPSDPSARSICIDGTQLLRLLQGMPVVREMPQTTAALPPVAADESFQPAMAKII